ncbi:MAG: hypothetical protein AB9834_20550 [Lentimicrobium sp.]
MEKNDQPKLWPFNPQAAILLSLLLLFFLFVMIAVIQKKFDWPSSQSEKLFFTGLFIISLVPILLAILQIILDRGGRFEYGPIKIDIAKTLDANIPGFVIPANLGETGQHVPDSNMVNILDALKKPIDNYKDFVLYALQQSIDNSIVIIDLEDGLAWWETRLLVLLSGAHRLGNPGKIVFVASKSGKEQCFIGWANTESLLKCLLKAHPKYIRAYCVAKAVSSQWNLVEPLYPEPPLNVQMPDTLPWMQKEAMHKAWMAFDTSTGLPNELFEEQVLQNELIREIENPEGGKYITIGRVIDLFGPILNTKSIDQNDPSELQLKNLYSEDLPFIAFTKDGKYSSLVSRYAIINEFFKKLTTKTQE